jgi:hypothetical protein
MAEGRSPCFLIARISFQNDNSEPSLPRTWAVEQYRGISYIVRDANNFPVTYVYFESERCGKAHDKGRPFGARDACE